MPVYMIRAGQHGPVKIGTSNQPFARLIDLQTGHYEKLRIIRLFEGGEAEETALHLRFADQHLQGEWHHFSRAMMGDLGLAEVPLSEPPPVVHGAELSAAEIIRLLGGATVLSRQYGITAQRSAIANWPKDGIPGRYWPALARLAATIPEAQHITLATLERHTASATPIPLDPEEHRVAAFFAEPTT